MNLKFENEFETNIRQLDKEVREEAMSEILDLESNPLPENSYVIHLPGGTRIQCLKLQEEDRNSKLNHRATYDIENNRNVKIYGIFPRGIGYKRIKEETQQRR